MQGDRASVSLALARLENQDENDLYSHILASFSYTLRVLLPTPPTLISFSIQRTTPQRSSFHV